MNAQAVLPVIDLQKAQNKSHRMEVAKCLVKTLETVGFLYIDNIPGVDLQLLLKNARKFFSQSAAQKQMVAKNNWNPSNKNQYRGYFPVQPGDSSYKEAFEMGLDDGSFDDPDVHPIFKERNMWPTDMEGSEDFKSDMQQYYKAMMKTGSEVLRLLALGSGLDEFYFESMFLPDTLSTLRLLHYPKRPGNPPESAMDGDTALCCSDHTDAGFVTLLATFHYHRLQIRTENNEWLDVTPRPNSLVMNIGEVLSHLSNGRFRATRHRVVDTMLDRYTVPFFFEPRYGASIDNLLPFEDNQKPVNRENAKEKKYGPWVIGRMQQFVEYKDLLKPLPAANIN